MRPIAGAFFSLSTLFRTAKLQSHFFSPMLICRLAASFWFVQLAIRSSGRVHFRRRCELMVNAQVAAIG
jgi:hypothetical protein